MNVKIELKNIDELKQLITVLESTVDKINNFKLEIKTSQCEHNYEIFH